MIVDSYGNTLGITLHPYDARYIAHLCGTKLVFDLYKLIHLYKYMYINYSCGVVDENNISVEYCQHKRRLTCGKDFINLDSEETRREFFRYLREIIGHYCIMNQGKL